MPKVKCFFCQKYSINIKKHIKKCKDFRQISTDVFSTMILPHVRYERLKQLLFKVSKNFLVTVYDQKHELLKNHHDKDEYNMKELCIQRYMINTHNLNNFYFTLTKSYVHESKKRPLKLCSINNKCIEYCEYRYKGDSVDFYRYYNFQDVLYDYNNFLITISAVKFIINNENLCDQYYRIHWIKNTLDYLEKKYF